jgi:hypothetical protein
MRGFSFAREVIRESSAGKDNLLLLAAAASGWKKILSRFVAEAISRLVAGKLKLCFPFITNSL